MKKLLKLFTIFICILSLLFSTACFDIQSLIPSDCSSFFSSFTDGADNNESNDNDNEDDESINDEEDSNDNDDNEPESGGNSGSSGNEPESGGDSGSSGNEPESGGDSGSSGNEPESGSDSGSGGNEPESGGDSGSSGNEPEDGNEQETPLTFAQKTDRYLNGAIINDANFINYYKNLGEYNFNAPIVSNAIYASPNGNGNGTKNNPYSLQDALDSVNKGQTLYLLGGTYTESTGDGFYIETKGDANNYITIRNYPGATVIITNSNTSNESYGLQIGAYCCYTVIEGIEIANVVAYNGYGIAIWGDGQDHLIFRNLNIHHIKTNATDPETEEDSSGNAILISGESDAPVSNVIVANCSMHDNITGWAETLSVTGNCEYVYVLENNVYDNSNIGIDFYGNAGYCETPSLDQPRYCVASGNTISNSKCGYADCAGLYVDGARDIILQYNTITDSQFGIEIGSEELQENYPVKNILVRNNIIYNNTVVGIRVGGYDKTTTGVVQSTTFANNTLVNNGTEIIIAKVNGINFVNNIIKAGQGKTVIRTDFSSTYCKNITFTKNYISVENTATNKYKFNMFESTQTGVSAFTTTTGATVITGNLTLDATFTPSADSVVINSGASTNYGDYDFNLKPRLNGTVDIGAIER